MLRWNHDGEPTQPTPTALANGGMGLPNNLVADEDGRVSLADFRAGTSSTDI